MSDDVQSIGAWRTNGELIADAARLGYLDGTVLDATHGEGAFWTEFLPRVLVCSDLYKPGYVRGRPVFEWDYHALPCFDGQFDVVVFDPPYKLNGTPMLGKFDDAYGVAKRTTRDEVMGDIAAGAAECFRVCSKYLLVKCQDQVEAGRMRWQTDLVTDTLTRLGARKVDRFDLLGTSIPQPAGWSAQPTNGKRKTHSTEDEAWQYVHEHGGGKVVCLDRVQRTARHPHSQLLVFAPKRKRSGK